MTEVVATNDSMTFQAFPKIARLFRDCVVTEKIDGTNAHIVINDEGTQIVAVGSRTRYITPGKQTDNFGFAKWVQDNTEELLKLGPGRHYGEWWGVGIQRGYDLSERRWSLFNVGRWEGKELPKCVSLVPVLYRGPFWTNVIRATLEQLKRDGSSAAPGYMKPEGLVVFHTAGSVLFKATCENDEKPKGVVDAQAAT